MGEKGFTLIEMLLVVAIIGFLVAILLPSVGGFGSAAKEKAAKADLRQLKTAVEVYYISFGAYPPTANWGDNDCELLTADGMAGYNRMVDQFPVDPYEDGSNTEADTYVYVLNGDSYIIASDKGASGDPTVPTNDEADANDADLYVSNARLITP